MFRFPCGFPLQIMTSIFWIHNIKCLILIFHGEKRIAQCRYAVRESGWMCSAIKLDVPGNVLLAMHAYSWSCHYHDPLQTVSVVRAPTVRAGPLQLGTL